jgi:curved DNA-binding protein CbpA
MHQPQVAHEKFKTAKQAYDILLDDKQRSVYHKYGLDYCLNGPPQEPPPKPAQSAPPPRSAPRSRPRAPPRTSPPEIICLGCHRTFARHFSMLDHLGNGHCRSTKGLESDYILGRFYEGLVGGWRDSNGGSLVQGAQNLTMLSATCSSTWHCIRLA